ncbi:class I SAM-dependent methyltransferase [Thiomonas bhubaneswarensis]|uniref:Methyltransferase domain n=1 Tax=Thiomonas bhubaneswarensis TaxID=339866 RepID=A0A0K6HV47_9BURK|nr:class I SAM-dependent methyltransferase [Thiomonas bhubaneswarensis]CUA94706.1 Methyltransferase domain [Thiomonas bhubaneswarensis]
MATENLVALPPSPWIVRHAAWLRPGATVLDVACGGGRHVRWLYQRGFKVFAVDRNAEAIAGLSAIADARVADLEAGPWPYGDQTFDAVVVTNYLWRPLLPRIVQAIASGGFLLYETFAVGQASLGKPSNPEFLLRPGELLDAVRPTLRALAYEDGFVETPHPAYVQRIAAVREAPNAQAADRYNLPI